MNSYFEHSRLLLRALEPEDIDTLYAWENDSSLWKYGSSVTPLSRFAIRQYISDAQQQDIFQSHQLRLMITLPEDGGKSIGMIDLFDFDPFHNRAGVGILIDAAHQKQGFATIALEMVKRYAFDFLHLSQLYAHVPQQNTASLQLFRNAGFSESGRLKSWVRIGNNFDDVVVLQHLNL